MTQRQQQQTYEQSRTIHAGPDEIFRFVSDIRNLPKYLPTTKQAEAQAQDRVRVQGEAHGHTYNADGFLKADKQNYRMEWGADERYYSGHLQVEPQDSNACNVTVQIRFSHKPGSGDTQPSDDDINEGLVKALESIENHVTGTGGKEEPQAAS